MREESETVVTIDLGEDFAYVWECDLPAWAVAKVLASNGEDPA